MKKRYFILATIILSLSLMVGCGKNDENENNNIIEKTEEIIEPSGEIEFEEGENISISLDIKEAPEDNSKPKEEYRQEATNFDENSQNYRDPSNEKNSTTKNPPSNKEETHTSSSSETTISSSKPPVVEETIIPTEGITSLKKIKGFANPKEFNVLNLDKDPDFLGYKNYVKNAISGASLETRIDNAIIYSNKKDKMSIEFYPLEDCYAIYLHCVLNKDAYQLAETEAQIKLNEEVLKSLLNLISSDADKLYETIYKDYEIESTLSEKTYTTVGNSKIKAEAMQKYVIYYIAKK